MKYLAISIVVFLLWSYSASKVEAAGVLFQDDFNSDSSSNWETVRNQQLKALSQPCLYKNDVASWQFQNNTVGMNISGPQCSSELIPRFLDLTSIYSYQVDVDITLNETADADRNILFAWHDEKNYYTLHLVGNQVSIEKVINNTYETLENSFRYPMYADETYHFTVIFKNQYEIILKINNQLELDLFDSKGTFSGFKTVGLQAGVFNSTDSNTTFDNLVVTSLDPGVDLDIPLLKQFDPEWGTEEYDSAKNWASKTDISTWGCSLTSMVMILRYHGIYFLPDKMFITPSTLNIWLKSQADGYVGDGALNWLAVTRLTKNIHDKFGTPKLEFHRLAADLELAKKEIQAEHPVIIPIQGHFLVGDGVTADEQDVSVKDPDFPYTTFSQYHTTPLAIDAFTPSFTDLSYFYLVHKPGLHIHLFNSNGEEQTDFLEFDEYLSAGNETSPLLAQHLFSKPSDGMYILQVSSDSSIKTSFQFLTYDKEGNYSDLSQAGYFSQEPKYFVLTYSKTQPPLFSKDITFSTFRSDLEIAQQLKQLANSREYETLDKEARFAQISGTERQKRYLVEISALMQNFQLDINADAFQILTADLGSINLQVNGIISR